VAGVPVELTAKEFDLLMILLDAHGRVLTRQGLLDRVWRYDRAEELDERAGRTVDVHIARLRRKLGPEGGCIITLRGVGYRFQIESQ
jgi:two-component system alkaline phosphatase synthesis response regulator PhoP